MTNEEALKLIKEDREKSGYVEQNTALPEKLIAGGYSLANSALFGIPDIIAKAVSADAYKGLQDLKARNRNVSAFGDIAGYLVPTGGALLKGAGAGLKAIGKAVPLADKLTDIGKIAMGGKTTGIGAAKDVVGGFGSGLKQGAITAAVDAVPRAATSVMSGEQDVPSALLNAGLGIAGGGVIGSAAKGLGRIARTSGIINKGESITGPISEKAIDAELASRGINSRDIKKSLDKTANMFGLDRTGNAVNNAETVKRAALNVLKKNDILNADEAQAFIQGTGKKFEELNNKYDAQIAANKALDANYKSISGFAISKGNPIYDDMISTYGEKRVKKAFIEMAQRIEDAPDVTTAKQLINKEIAFANKATNKFDSDMGDIAHIIKNQLEENILKLDPKYPEYKADWKALQPLRYMVARDKMSISPISKAGSDTAMKLLTGSALGGGAGLATADPNADPTQKVLAAAGGAALGGMANTAVTGATNYIGGKLGAATNLAMKGIDKVGSTSAGKFAGKVATALNPVSGAERLATEFTPIDLDKPNMPEAEAQEANKTEKVVPEEAKEAAKETVNEKYLTRIQEKLIVAWRQKYAAKGVPFEAFYNNVASVTDNFDPKKSYKILFDTKTEQDKYLRDYNIALKLKDVDVQSAYEQNKSTQGFAGTLERFTDPEAVEIKKQGYNNLVDIVGQLISTPEVPLSAKERTRIEGDISTIMKGQGSAEEKNQALLSLLNEKYGLGVDILQELGLI